MKSIGRERQDLHKSGTVITVFAAALIATASIASRAAAAQQPAATPAPIVLVCEHGSVKSVIAASLFNEAASERGLPFRAIARGVTPDASVPSKIVAALGREGFDVGQFKPAAVSQADVARASRVVAIGADVSAVTGKATASVERWDDVPAATVDYPAAHRALKRHVDALLDQLERATH